jgi:Holliday junction resolvase RusA-like endonuclease
MTPEATEARSITISFFVPGEAKGKARPRVTRYGTYTPDPEGWVALVTAEATARRSSLDNPAEYTGPIAMNLVVERAMPKSWPKKKRGAMKGHPCLSTPDTVNIAAAICDALNHVFYVDDRQVHSLSITKYWAEEHGTWITLQYEEVLG